MQTNVVVMQFIDIISVHPHTHEYINITIHTSYMHIHNSTPCYCLFSTHTNKHTHTYTNVTFMCCKHQQSVTPTQTLWHANQTLKGHYSTMYTGVSRYGMKSKRLCLSSPSDLSSQNHTRTFNIWGRRGGIDYPAMYTWPREIACAEQNP